MTLFRCIYCEYQGSGGWMHLKNKHPDKLDDWLSKQKVEPLQNLNDPDIYVNTMEQSVSEGAGMTTITRKFRFDAGHRVYQHESKCANIHGHSYDVFVTCSGDLDSIGRIIDFSVIKEICGSWIDNNLDHGMILFSGDPLVSTWSAWTDQKYYLMDANPTAENLAKHLFLIFKDMLAVHGVTVVKVVVGETPNCAAEYSE